MFIYTAKFNRKKAVWALLLLGAVLIAIILIAGGGGSRSAASLSATVKTNEQRIAYLTELGWEVSAQPLEEEAVVIPREFSDVYRQYNEIQKAQGFDLSKYGGHEATRYTYEVKNHPDTDGRVCADMLVCDGKVIAGDIQSPELGGFMTGLKYPEKANQSMAESA